MADERIFKPRAPPRQRIDIRCLDDLVAITAQRAGRLIIGKEEDNVRTFGQGM
jgi:hypothetical protein